ncbi:MAG: DUF4286 family protein [Candidatus Sericytochromatia bacterium]
MIIYSVTVSIERPQAEEWLMWMEQDYLPEALASGYIQSYLLNQLMEPIYEPNTLTYNLQYEMQGFSELDAFRRRVEPTLEGYHRDRFGEQSLAVRSVLKTLTKQQPLA